MRLCAHVLGNIDMLGVESLSIVHLGTGFQKYRESSMHSALSRFWRMANLRNAQIKRGDFEEFRLHSFTSFNLSRAFPIVGSCSAMATFEQASMPIQNRGSTECLSHSSVVLCTVNIQQACMPVQNRPSMASLSCSSIVLCNFKIRTGIHACSKCRFHKEPFP